MWGGGFMLYKKKYSKVTAKIIIIMFFMTIFSGVSSIKAYDSSSYNNSQVIRIGLESMLSNTMSVTINGNYMVNSKLYPSGTSFQITNNSGKNFLDGVEVTPISFVSQTVGKSISITSGGISRNYMGDMSFKIDNYTLKILPINSVKLEDYLKGVVPYEVSEYYSIEALKVQAIAARTYAMYNIGRFATLGYDLTDDTYSQVYGSYDNSYVKCNQAVDSTKGQVLTYNGRIIEALYSANDGGYTEDSGNVWDNSFPYFVSKLDSFDTKYSWAKSFTTAQIETTLKNNKIILATDTFVGINLGNITFYKSGRVSNIEIDCKDISRNQKLSKNEARTFLSLPSALYIVTFDKSTDTYTFIGQGNGHGIGMSQVGAQNRALSGQTYKEILNFYYENANITEPIITPTPVPTPTVDVTGWNLKEDGKWYFFNIAGVMQTAWVKDGATWYFLNTSGVMQTGWVKDGVTWYFLNSSGAMQTGWAKVGATWYFLNSSGAMQTGWIQSSGKWYYLYSSGAMAANTTINGYRVNSNGAWIH